MFDAADDVFCAEHELFVQSMRISASGDVRWHVDDCRLY